MSATIESEILHKTIHIQSCVIEGHSIEAIFRAESKYLRELSGANVVGFCLHHKNTLQLDFVLDHEAFLYHCFKENNLHPHTLILETLYRHNKTHFTEGVAYLENASLANFLMDNVPENKIKELEIKHQFKTMVTYPLYSLNKELIGCLLFCYFEDNTPNHKNLSQITQMIQTLIRPFHYEGNNIFHVKCVQISTEMPLLTSQEKRILKKLLKAKPYAQIADEMHLSLNTVKTHLKHIYAKYKVKSKLELYNKVKGINE